MPSEPGRRESRNPSHAEVRAAGEPTRLQKEELRSELARQREIAREAERLLEGTSDPPDAEAIQKARELLTMIEAGATAQPAADRFLFVTGCARSGTTAMVRLLNADPRIALGLERFKYLQGALERRHFTRDYFLNPTPDETNVFRPKLYRRLAKKIDSGRVEYVGDKVLTRDGTVYPRLAGEFPECRFLYMFRDLEGVAGSFERRAADPNDANWPPTHDHRRAVSVWNESLAALRGLLSLNGRDPAVFVVSYERLFSGDRDYLRRVYGFLELELGTEMEKAFRDATRDWDQRIATAEALDRDVRSYLQAERDPDLERMATELAEAAPG